MDEEVSGGFRIRLNLYKGMPSVSRCHTDNFKEVPYHHGDGDSIIAQQGLSDTYT